MPKVLFQPLLEASSQEYVLKSPCATFGHRRILKGHQKQRCRGAQNSRAQPTHPAISFYLEDTRTSRLFKEGTQQKQSTRSELVVCLFACPTILSYTVSYYLLLFCPQLQAKRYSRWSSSTCASISLVSRFHKEFTKAHLPRLTFTSYQSRKPICSVTLYPKVSIC